MKNKIIIDFLCSLFGGYFGLHCFINKKYGKGILYLITVGLFGFGWIYDTIKLGIQLLKYKEPSPEVWRKSNDETTHPYIVYITPSGKKYHFNKECAGPTAEEASYFNVDLTHTPCDKCVKF